MVKNADYSQKARRFNWNKFGGKEEALLEAQTWRDTEEQKLKDNLECAIVEHTKTIEENKKLKEQQEAEYKRLKYKQELEDEKKIRMLRAEERLIKNKKLKEIQEDLDYFNECLTMNIEQFRAKWENKREAMLAVRKQQWTPERREKLSITLKQGYVDHPERRLLASSRWRSTLPLGSAS